MCSPSNNFFRAWVSSHLTSMWLILVTFKHLQYFNRIHCESTRSTKDGHQAIIIHASWDDISKLDTKANKTPANNNLQKEVARTFQQLHPQNQQQLLKIIGPGHFHSECYPNRNSHKRLTPQQACLQGTQVTPSFTGSLGSSHITTSASTSFEASFPQFELRMTSQTTTAVEPQQNFG